MPQQTLSQDPTPENRELARVAQHLDASYVSPIATPSNPRCNQRILYSQRSDPQTLTKAEKHMRFVGGIKGPVDGVPFHQREGMLENVNIPETAYTG